jgi:septal ring factor EnvC (AmiA/AmiB activator)
MSADLDWARLEAAVARAIERLRAAADENRSLREEVARLEAELQSARAAAPPTVERTDDVRRRLTQLEGELEALLQESAG